LSKSSLSTRRAQRGLTLIELMISIAIGLVVIGAVSYMYLGSKGAYRGNESLARTQEAGRFALDAMTRDIRRAGALGCGSLVSISNQPVAISVLVGSATTVNPAAVTVDATNRPIPVQGFKPAAYTPLPIAAPPAGWAPPVLVAPATAPLYWGGDILQLQVAAGLPARMSAAVDTANGNITIADNTLPNTTAANFKQGDYALLADCSSAAIFQISSLPGGAAAPAALLSYVTGGAIPPLPPVSVNTFPTVQHFDQVTYYVGQVPNSAPPQSALYRYSLSSGAVDEVVENVEDMDVVYGVGVGGAMSTGTFKHADTMAAADWGNVISVRVSVVAVGDQGGVAPPAQSFPFHGAGAALTPTPWTAPAGDTRLRQVFSATTALRDRLQ
jgi:type IV pilus assembly protein PilW